MNGEYEKRLEDGLKWRRKNPNYIKDYNRQYRKTAHGRKVNWKANKKWRNKNREKIRATDTLRYAIMKGTVKKPNACSICKSKEKMLLHGHHPDYSKPLEVIWVCHKCHRKLHQGLLPLIIGGTTR